ncbi:hypothetical protein AQUCO_00901035v1 [Aquilegia coerulea]|uniref:FBD domain-containing protein n=1 Tax=Aquilegia coerulea TaxID=218851 RepID=A0A2G5EGJ8_AQUCA|nr:hypothetical protein AQUCO_00901035v1 [Aquilegia coerulea]
MATDVVFSEEYSSDKTLQRLFSVSTMEYVLERCPMLKTLGMPIFKIASLVKETNKCLLDMISKLKHLESIKTLNTEMYIKKILIQIHTHCQGFQSLTAWNFINRDIASLIALLPNIKHLVLRDCFVARDGLIQILSSCRKLELLDAANCVGFDADDAVILALASYVKIFKSEGSTLSDKDPSGYQFDGVNYYVRF